MRILGLETSCDETAAAVVVDGTCVWANIVATQHALHERYGGVVPEIASRAHLEQVRPTLLATLDQAGLKLTDIDAVAVSHRPGLVGSLIVGVAAAKALAWGLGKPLIGIDHVEAHLHAPLLYERGRPAPTAPLFPALGLVVSGGHTSLYRLEADQTQVRLGQTIDDAIGEAYDKAAVMLEAGYPGGPHLDRLAQQGDPTRHSLPRSLLGPESLDFSFSGLKTALLYKIRGHPVTTDQGPIFPRALADLSATDRVDLAASFQDAATAVVLTKLKRAQRLQAHAGHRCRSLLVGGGVSANSLLRERLARWCDQENMTLHLPPLAYCVDNAAMIAGLAARRLQEGRVDDLSLQVLATSRG